MARVTADLGMNIVNPAVWYGWVTRANSNELVISDGWNTAVYQGHGLAYGWDGAVIGGILTGYTQFYGNQHVATLDQFSASAVVAQSYIARNDVSGFLSSVLGGNDSVSGSRYADWIATYAGDDYISGGGGDDQIFAGAGNDTIVLSSGNTFVDAGLGFDLVYLPGSGGGYGQARTAEGWQFWDNAQGVNANLASVERVAFSDGILAFDTGGNAGQAFRIYQAAFDRTPDASGLSYWVKSLDEGRGGLEWLAASFIGSGEFQDKYGTPASVTNEQFVGLLYANVLHRAPDAGGFSHWGGQLDAGVSRATILAHFSESPENQANVAGQIDNGIWLV